MTLNYQLTMDDYMEASRLHLKSKPVEYYGLRVFGGLCLIIGIIPLALRGAKDLASYAILSFLVLYGAYIILVSTVFSRHVHSRRLKKYPNFFQPAVLEVSATQLNIQGTNSAMQVAWSAFSSFKESPNLFLIFWSPKIFQLVPKRAFANEAELEQFRAWASGIGQKDAPPLAPIPQP